MVKIVAKIRFFGCIAPKIQHLEIFVLGPVRELQEFFQEMEREGLVEHRNRKKEKKKSKLNKNKNGKNAMKMMPKCYQNLNFSN